MDLTTIAAAYEKIAQFGFPFMLFLALVGSYYGIWEWGREVQKRESQQAEREHALELKYRTELTELKASAAAREAAQQERIDQLFNRMIDAAGLIEKSARAVRR
jgi:hypothetical protein